MRPKTADTTMRFITRMPDALWRVWITFKDSDFGQQYFSDKTYGGKDHALKAATTYRDRVVRKHKIPLRSYAGSGFCVQHTRSTTGAVGITLSVDSVDDVRRVSWTAKNAVDGRLDQMSRSIRKYGYVGAWRLVARFRQAHTRLPVPKNPPPPPDWLRRWAEVRGFDMPE